MKKSKKWILCLLLVLAALLTACGQEDQEPAEDVHYRVISYKDEKSDKTRYQIWQDGKMLDERKQKVQLASSLDGSRAVVAEQSGDLWKVDMAYNGKLHHVANRVVHFKMAASGRALAYWTKNQELYLYRDGKTRHIGHSDAESWGCAISPDGTILGYTDGDASYCYYDGRVHKMEEKINWLAIADGAKYVYGQAREDPVLFVQKGWDTSTRRKLPTMPLYFNADLSQVICSFLSYDWKTGLVADGETVVPMGDTGDIVPVRSGENTFYANLGNMFPIENVDSFYGRLYETRDVRDVMGEIYEYPFHLYRLEEDGPELIHVGWKDFRYIRDLFYYTDDQDTLYRLDTRTKEQEQVAEGVRKILGDIGGTVYFLKEETLFCQEPGMEPVELDLTVHERYGFYSPAEGRTALACGERKVDGVLVNGLWAIRGSEIRLIVPSGDENNWNWIRKYDYDGLCIYQGKKDGRNLVVLETEYDSLWENGLP